jgi:hypothetical protein
MQRHALGSILALALLVSGACGKSPSEPSEPPPPVSALACENPALAATTAQPFDKVEVTGISGIGDETWVEYETAAGTKGLTAVVVDGEGKAQIVVPANPDSLMKSGTLSLIVTDGIASCGPLSIEVMPLDPAQGDPLSDLAAAIDELSLALASQFGADPAAVNAASLADLPPQEVPLALLLQVAAAVDPATELAALTADQAAFLQALLAKFDLASVFSEVTASVNALSAASTGAVRAKSVPTAAATRALDGCEPLGSVPAGLFNLDDPQKLSEYIKAARGANDSLGPLKQSIGSTAEAFAVMGLIAPPVGPIVGWTTFVAVLVQEMRANLYPSAITRLEFQLDHDRIEEDWDTSLGDPQIRWSFAKIWATNNGMGLARVGIDFITTQYGLPGGFTDAVANAGVAALDFKGKEALGNRLDDLENDPNGGAECWGVGVTEFGPVVIPDDSGEKWVRAEVLTGDAIALDTADNRKLDPKKIGSATLRVRTQEAPFPGPFGFEDKTVEVLRKTVVWLPSQLLVKNPGSSQTVKFRIDNSKHNGAEYVSVIPGPGLGSLPAPTFSGGVHTLTFTTPSDREKYPTFITALSTSKELPPASPERSGNLEIIADERVEISPRDLCVSAGDSATFTATITGQDGLTASWEIESGAGTLSSHSGETVSYTAPGTGNGTVTLHCYLDQDSKVEDRVSFRYGACSGLAVYYGQEVKINFPFLVGGECSNPDLDDEFQEITLPEEGIDPTLQPAPSSIWVDRSETYSPSLYDAGIFGDKPLGVDNCILASFSAEAGMDATLTGSSDGTRLDIDISTNARSNCVDMGQDLGLRSSTAVSSMSIAARFDFDLSMAANYRLKVSLSCDSYQSPNLPPIGDMVSVVILRVEPDGTILPPTPSTIPIQVTCGPDSPNVDIDRLMIFDAPAQPEQKDHVMVLFQASNASYGALADAEGEANHTGYLRGYVSVKNEN